MKGLLSGNFITKLFHWEYWPFKLFYIPVFLLWFWYYLRSGSPFFFCAANPGIKNGGMMNDPKFPILKKFNSELIPATEIVLTHTPYERIIRIMEELGLSFPVIVKPDIGERGLKVELIHNENELKEYHERAKFDYLLQEYINLPLEVGIFYYRYPGTEKGKISSVVVKEMLQVTGDGRSTVRELVIKYARARLQLNSLEKRIPEMLDTVPALGEVVELESIGNHNRGTTFLNGNELINERLREIVESMARQVDGFFYGRFDLKCESVEELIKGKGIKILELNGAKSEPAHIYQPGFSIFRAYGSLFKHWHIMYRICRINHRNGFTYMNFKSSYTIFKNYQAYLRMVKSA